VSPRLNKFHLILAVFAGAVLIAGFIIQHIFAFPEAHIRVTLWVIMTLIAFYIIGLPIRYFLISKVFPQPVEEEPTLEEEIPEEAIESDLENNDRMMFETPTSNDEANDDIISDFDDL